MLAERNELSKRALSSNADAERETKVTELNGKLYTLAKLSSISGVRQW